ncbi:MFS transporter [Streptomyces sp. NBC_00083]|uniref:MFS transporter n=1 Tax=Streptomyces sp. NBC_00083 TaxID=2975647 RepID=UPI0022527CAE|nr:MFS transporter [Streptomyces sp. NBC_00083]MCX5381876.1 MFS transporter [Streptomyces sp. NBC_00083]
MTTAEPTPTRADSSTSTSTTTGTTTGTSADAEPGPKGPAPSGSGPASSPSGSGSGPASSPSGSGSGPTARIKGLLGRLRPAPDSWPMRHPVAFMTIAGAVTHVLWFFLFANSGGDLAAQDAWTEFVGRNPESAYNLAWYGGMHPVSYSVVSPYLMALLGVRTTMMIAGTVSAGLTTLILVRVKAVRNPLACSFAALFAFLCNAMSGRVTFGLGTMFALGAVAAVFCWPHNKRENRWPKAAVAAPCAALATASSPVAGLFLGLVAAALFLNKRRPGAYAIGLPPVVVVALSAWLFPFSGTQPMSLATTSGPFLFAVLILFLVPKDWRTVRTAAVVYGVAVLLCFAIQSQIGSNITRLSMLFAGVVLLAALPYTVPKTLKWYAVVLAFVGLNGWIGFKSVDDIVHTAPAATWARDLAPLVDQLQGRDASTGRVEVVPASSHREASAFTPYVNLARGWNRQADMERNPLFYDDTLNADNYHAWLDRWAVRYVVLPLGPADRNGAVQEGKLIEQGLPYLKQVWSNEHWRLFAVDDPTPLADPPATVKHAGEGELTVDVRSAGTVLIRIPYSPWLKLVDEHGKGVEAPQETPESKLRGHGTKTYTNLNGCLRKSPATASGDEWTELVAPKPGTYRVAAPYSIPRGSGCPEGDLVDP